MTNPTTSRERRTLRFETYDELLADAEAMAVQPTVTLGNWSVGQIFRHIALSIDSMQQEPSFTFPRPVQWLFRLFMKKRMTTRTLSPGFKLPKKGAHLIPGETSVNDGITMMRAAIERVNQSDFRSDHGGFGKISKEDWDAFQPRHCEMHMSHIVPE